MSVPAITSLNDIVSKLNLWRQQINPLVSQPILPRSPFNFQAQGGIAGTTGILLGWDQVPHADGYEIQSSPTGDFSTVGVSVVIDNGAQTSYFDSLGVASTKRYYKIRATGGTVAQPHTIKGTLTAAISATSGSGTTSYDNTSHQSGGGAWNPPGGSGGVRGGRQTF